MKRLLVTTLSALTLSSLVTPAFANTNQIAVGSRVSQNVIQITPINLVSAGYQGRFTGQGIPSGGAFLTGLRNNRIQAEDLVKVAISQGRLSEEALKDQKYLNSLQGSIDNFKRRRL